MKSIFFIPLLLLITCAVQAGNPEPAAGKKSVLFLGKPAQPVSAGAWSLADTGYYSNAQKLFQMEKKIHDGKSITIAGICMFGGGVLVTMAAVGFSREVYNINYRYYNYYPYPNPLPIQPTRSIVGPTTGAALCYVFGAGSLLASIPLITIGAIKWSTGSFEKRMYMSLQGSAGPNGMGMKMTF